MAYISLPNLNYNNLKFNIIFYKEDNLDENSIYISYSLHHYLTLIKEQINLFENYWDNYKKITNPYEFIHTMVPGTKFSVCKYKPLSRSFFKMIEIINVFDLLNDNIPIKSFHLAEGPGGFIEAFNYKRNNKNDTYYGMTLISSDTNIPSWKKSENYLNNNKNIIIEYGESKNGDLFLKQNLIYCYKNFSNKMNYITADGGFDFSLDFNKQEDVSFKLIIAQIFYAIIMQKKGGNFVLKIFDIFKYKTVEILFLLSNLYNCVYIYKPYTSRVANSEKYIICKSYKNNIENINDDIINNFDNIMDNIDNIKSLFSINIPKFFINKVQEINSIYGQQQIENINSTLNLIREFLNLKNKYNINTEITHTKNDKLDNIFKFSPENYSLNNNFIDYNDENICIEDKMYEKNNNSDNEDNSEKCESETDDFNNFELDEDISQNVIIEKKDKNLNNNNLIEATLSYEKFTNKITILKNINIQKSITWCNRYLFPINKMYC